MSSIRPESRRHFIKTFTFTTVYSNLLGKKWSDVMASPIKLQAGPTVGVIRINLNQFPALLNESGSVRLGLNPLRGSSPNGPFFPVIVNRGANNTFFALKSQCTHQSCVVDAMDASLNLMFCPCHGSIFGIDGRRVSGPASSSLAKYIVAFDGRETLTVEIPNLGYSIIASNVQSTGGGHPRLRLDFAALRNVEYEVHYRESLSQEPALVPFASTPEGPFDQNSFTVTSNANASLYVERNTAAGFFQISVRVTEV